MQVASSPESINPIAVGAKAPNSALVTMDATPTTLYETLGGQAGILIFYRGSW